MKNKPVMKSTLYTKLIAVTLGIALVACSAASPESDKKAELEKLKKEQAELNDKIAKLEAEIAKENPTEAKVKAKEVDVTELKPHVFNHYIQTQGAVEAEDNILVSARSMGTVTRVYVTEGQAVSAGQVLAQLDNSVIVQNIEGMKSQLELAKSVYQRQKSLWDQKIGTEVQYLQAKTNMESLEKQLSSLQEQSEMTKIKSPIKGTVDEVFVKIGEAAAPGQPAVRVVNTSDLKVTANVSEAYVTQIKKGNKVLVNIPELKKDIEATVTFVGKNIDVLSRTFVVEVKLPTLEYLRPNMTGVIKVIFHSEPNAITVPINVVQEVNGEKIVYIAETNGNQTVAKKKTVTVNGVYGSEAEVKGLRDGDKLITVGYQGLNDGENIKI